MVFVVMIILIVSTGTLILIYIYYISHKLKTASQTVAYWARSVLHNSRESAINQCDKISHPVLAAEHFLQDEGGDRKIQKEVTFQQGNGDDFYYSVASFFRSEQTDCRCMRKNVSDFIEWNQTVFKAVYSQETFKEDKMEDEIPNRPSFIKLRKKVDAMEMKFKTRVKKLGTCGTSVTNLDMFAISTCYDVDVYILTPVNSQTTLFKWMYYPPLTKWASKRERLISEFITLLRTGPFATKVTSNSVDERSCRGPCFYPILGGMRAPKATGIIGMCKEMLTGISTIEVPDELSTINYNHALSTLLQSSQEELPRFLDVTQCAHTLHQFSCLPTDTLNHIISSQTEERQVHELLKFIRRSGSDVFRLFCQVLIHDGHTRLLALLYNMEIAHQYDKRLALLDPTLPDGDFRGLHEKLIEDNWDYLLSELYLDDFKDFFENSFWTDDVTELHEIEEVCLHERDLKLKYLLFLRRQPRCVFQEFCEYLRTSGKSHVYDRLICENNSSFVKVQTLISHHKTLEEFVVEYKKMVNLLSELVVKCETQADLDQSRRKKGDIAVVTGSSVSIIGGILAIVGIALTPVTFGASVGLTVAGGTIGVLGGATNATARVTEAVKRRKDFTQLAEDTNALRDNHIDFEAKWNRLQLVYFQMSSDNFSRSIQPPMLDPRTAAIVVNVIRSIKSLYAIPIDALRTSVQAARVAGTVLGPLSLIIDTAFLTNALISLKSGSKTKAAEQIRTIATFLSATKVVISSMVAGNVLDD